MWDNRHDNAQKNDGKRRPDFRCKKNREHVIWPPKEEKSEPAAQATPAAAVVPPPAVLAPEERGEALRKLLSMHTTITKHVVAQESPLFATGQVGDSPEASSARINCIFIAAKEMGLHR
jgi:hypothetical protein